MGRNSCCVKQKLRKGLWSPEEDEKLYNYITRFGVGCWSSVPKLAGLQRCGKSCRLRWINYLRPDLKRGMFSQEEEDLIISLHEALGNRWAQIAAQLPGRTDNEIKNFWNSSLKKKLIKQGIDPNTHKPIKETEVKDEKDFIDSGSLQILQPKGLPDLASSTRMEQQAYHFNSMLCSDGGKMLASRENYANKQVYDPLFLPEFQANVDPDGYQSNFLSHCQQNLVRPYEQNQIEGNPSCGFNSMPNLTNFDHQNMIDTDYCHNSASRMSKYLMNEAKESSSYSSNVNSQARIQMNNNVIENAGTFSWDAENKLDSMFQFQFSGIQIEERKPSPWQEGHQKLHSQSSGDFSNFPLTSLSQELTGANLDVFQQI
ncbi:hypothetical protein Pfo_011104 [Paulownia fortunei]|nr:hypothetical protein Pfo_011104 [Paulownia fortunei]